MRGIGKASIILDGADVSGPINVRWWYRAPTVAALGDWGGAFKVLGRMSMTSLLSHNLHLRMEDGSGAPINVSNSASGSGNAVFNGVGDPPSAMTSDSSEK
jgi:hypothetical protein